MVDRWLVPDVPARHTTTLLSLGAIALCVMLMTGCEFKGADAEGTVEAATAYWHPQAVGLRVYPSTRFVESDSRTILEARIELRDQMGDTVKAAGDVGVELFTADDGSRRTGQRLYRWDVSMQTLADQRLYFDSVTRTYLFRLETADGQVAHQPTMLRVAFTRASDGRRLQDEALIEP